MNAGLTAAREALAGQDVWVVGGAVRDRLLGRATDDVDLVAPGNVSELARRLSRGTRASAFALSEEFGAWRVTARDRSWQADLMPLEGETVEDDLGRRDFTVNAMAEPLAGGDVVDPFGGRDDLARRRLRMVTDHTFADDPLRVMRLARLSVALGFDFDDDTRTAARASAPRLPEVPGERAFGELKQILAVDRPDLGVDALDAVDALDHLLPEIAAQRGVEQNRFHHLDVYAHTLEVLMTLARLDEEPELLGAHAEAVSAFLAEPLADDLTRGQALRFGALLHDVAKPATRDETAEGRITFMGHDALGADMSRDALGRLRASQRLREHVAALTRHHLRLGFLVHRRPLSRRDVHAYLRACEPVEVDVTLLSIADRLATRGDNAQAAIAAHLELARDLLGEALRWRSAGPPEPLVRGDELAAELGIGPGPDLGRLLRELEGARFADEIASRQDAIVLARRLSGQPPHE
jgi:poly(A) polymerase